MTTLNQLRKAAARHGATVDHRSVGKWHLVNVDAPQGKVWSCDGSIHTLALEWQTVDSGWRDAAIEDCLGRMEYGTMDCEEPDCDICHPGYES